MCDVVCVCEFYGLQEYDLNAVNSLFVVTDSYTSELVIAYFFDSIVSDCKLFFQFEKFIAAAAA
jgi:hypothetical protein